MIAGIGNNQGSLLRTYSKGNTMAGFGGTNTGVRGPLGTNASGPSLPVPQRRTSGMPDKLEVAKKAKQTGQRKAMMGSMG